MVAAVIFYVICFGSILIILVVGIYLSVKTYRRYKRFGYSESPPPRLSEGRKREVLEAIERPSAQEAVPASVIETATRVVCMRTLMGGQNPRGRPAWSVYTVVIFNESTDYHDVGWTEDPRSMPVSDPDT